VKGDDNKNSSDIVLRVKGDDNKNSSDIVLRVKGDDNKNSSDIVSYYTVFTPTDPLIQFFLMKIPPSHCYLFTYITCNDLLQ
jgi:hypothetical protein